MSEVETAKEGGHWYHTDGRPCYTLLGKNGYERPVTIRDARKLNLYPSVTRIAGMLDKPGLNNWLRNQMLTAAATLDRSSGESNESFIDRIKLDARNRSEKATERGKLLHGDIEKSIRGEEHGSGDHIRAITIEMEKLGLNLLSGVPEHSFAHSDGFAGKTDWHEGFTVCDFKSKEEIINGKRLAWDDQCIQLAAYAHGLKISVPRCINIFVGVNDCKVVAHEWTPQDVNRGLEMFMLLLKLWQLKNNFDPTNDNNLL